MNVLKKKQKEYAVATNIDDRSAQTGDQAILDFEGRYNGKTIPHGNGENFALTIGAKAFLPEFDKALVGKNISDTFDIDVGHQGSRCLRSVDHAEHEGKLHGLYDKYKIIGFNRWIRRLGGLVAGLGLRRSLIFCGSGVGCADCTSG